MHNTTDSRHIVILPSISISPHVGLAGYSFRAEQQLPSREDVLKAIRERIDYLQDNLLWLQQEASKTEADELSEFCIEWATKKRYELMIESVKGIIMRLNKYQEDVENKDVPWDLERVEAVAAEFLHHQKADFEAEVDRGLARTEAVLKSLAIPNISLAFFGIPYGEVHQKLQEKLVDLMFRILLNHEDNDSEDVGSDKEVESE